MDEEAYLAALEELIAEFEDEGLSESAAYAAASEGAYDRMIDRFADRCDAARDRFKHGEGY